MSQEEFLVEQGKTIARAIDSSGYITRQLTGDLIAWEITQQTEEWWALLTFIPRPVNRWHILPATHDPRQSEIYRIIEQTIGGLR